MKKIIRTIRKIIMIWLGLSLISLGYYFHFTHESHRFLLTQLKEQNHQFMSAIESDTLRLHQDLAQVFYQLSHSPLLFDFANTEQDKLKKYIQNEWLVTLINNQFIYQLRYIDNTGQEIIRVDNPPHFSQPHIVPDNQLLDLSSQDYFHYAKQLHTGEQGYYGIKIKPETNQPVIRMIYPVELNKHRQGYFIACLSMTDIIHDITANKQDYKISLINTDGTYILNNHPETLFDYSAPEKHSFNIAETSPDLWHYIQQSPGKSGNYHTKSGLYSFRSFQSGLFNTSPNLLLMVMMPHDQINSMLIQREKEVLNNTITLQLILGILAGILSLVWETYSQRKLEHTFNQVALDNSSAVALTNERHQILHANIRFCELFEKEIHEIKGKLIYPFNLKMQVSTTENYP